MDIQDKQKIKDTYGDAFATKWAKEIAKTFKTPVQHMAGMAMVISLTSFINVMKQEGGDAAAALDTLVAMGKDMISQRKEMAEVIGETEEEVPEPRFSV